MPSGRRTIISVMPDAVRARSRRIPGSSVLPSGKCVRRRKVFRGRMSTGSPESGSQSRLPESTSAVTADSQLPQRMRTRTKRRLPCSKRVRRRSRSSSVHVSAVWTAPGSGSSADSPAQPHCIISIVRQKGSVRRVGNRPMSASSPVSGRTITTCSSGGTESDSRVNPA